MSAQQSSADRPVWSHTDNWLSKDSGDFTLFEKQLDRETMPGDVPNAIAIQKKIPVYDGEFVRQVAGDRAQRLVLLSEWTSVFATGAGIILIKNAMDSLDVVDRATAVFEALIDQEKAGKGGGGDHFAKAGANDRVWNVLEKHCLADPANFASYYASDAIAMASETWLGRGYQMTAQVNRVNPGGAAQKPHRDYHLGFMLPEQTTGFPVHVHRMSPFLTLQGAVAHCDMPLESGPTQLLPFSQQFLEGYLAFGRDAFQQHFAQNHIQIPLEKGDIVFFNPAIMHAAGENLSQDIYRMGNLLQVSSAFGRAMETVDRHNMSKILYPALLAARKNTAISDLGIKNAIAACAEGYSFPTNLDLDPPIGGLAPKTQAQLMAEALDGGASSTELAKQLDQLKARQQS